VSVLSNNNKSHFIASHRSYKVNFVVSW